MCLCVCVYAEHLNEIIYGFMQNDVKFLYFKAVNSLVSKVFALTLVLKHQGCFSVGHDNVLHPGTLIAYFI